MMLESYNPKQTPEIIRLFKDVFADAEGPEEGQLIADVVAELIGTTDSSQLLGYVSTSEGEITGCIFFSRLTLASGKDAFILSPVAVSSREQGKGLGQQLINFGIRELGRLGVELVFTYGDPAFYSKVGFVKIGEDIVKAPRKLTYPQGWLAQSLNNEGIKPEKRPAKCVDALDRQEIW